MAVISILNSKGGVGKTTLATNLSGGLAARGLGVLLVDSDPQGTSTDWGWVRESERLVGPEIRELSTLRSIGGVEKEKKHFDHVVIDGSARLEELSIAAIKLSDVIIIPIRPSAADFWAVRSLWRLVQKRQAWLQRTYGGIKKLRCALCVAQQVYGSRLAQDVGAAAADLGIPMLSTRMGHRVAYAAALQEGKTVPEYDPAGRAAEEIAALTSEILHFITQ